MTTYAPKMQEDAHHCTPPRNPPRFQPTFWHCAGPPAHAAKEYPLAMTTAGNMPTFRRKIPTAFGHRNAGGGLRISLCNVSQMPPTACHISTLHICVSMCVHPFTPMHTRAHTCATHTHTHTHTHISACVQAYVGMCAHVQSEKSNRMWTHTCILFSEYTHMHIHTRTNARTHTHTHTHTRMHTCTNMHTYAHMPAHAHTHIHTHAGCDGAMRHAAENIHWGEAIPSWAC